MNKIGLLSCLDMDRQLTFEILLYLNIFFTSFFVFIEALFLVIKYFYVHNFGGYQPLTVIFHNLLSADGLTLLNESFLLLLLGGFEGARLWLGQEENLQKKISVVFRILVRSQSSGPWS